MKKQEVNEKSRVNGAHLKWIAIVSMMIDHLGGGLLEFFNTSAAIPLESLYTTTRLIGRLAFPIFAFLIIQAFNTL